MEVYQSCLNKQERKDEENKACELQDLSCSILLAIQTCKATQADCLHNYTISVATQTFRVTQMDYLHKYTASFQRVKA